MTQPPKPPRSPLEVPKPDAHTRVPGSEAQGDVAAGPVDVDRIRGALQRLADQLEQTLNTLDVMMSDLGSVGSPNEPPPTSAMQSGDSLDVSGPRPVRPALPDVLRDHVRSPGHRGEPS